MQVPLNTAMAVFRPAVSRLSLQVVIISGGGTALRAVLHQPAAAAVKATPAKRAARSAAAPPVTSPQVRARTMQRVTHGTMLGVHPRVTLYPISCC